MLILSRQRDESVMVGEVVKITVVDIRGDKVRLGIEAPQSVPVYRREVYEAILRDGAKTKGPKHGDSHEATRDEQAEPGSSD